MRGSGEMTLKTTSEGRLSSVYLPEHTRIKLMFKKWTILQAIEAGLNLSSGEGCGREECIRAKKKLAGYIIREEIREERFKNG